MNQVNLFIYISWNFIQYILCILLVLYKKTNTTYSGALPLDTWRKLNVHRSFRRRPGREVRNMLKIYDGAFCENK